MYCCCLAAVVSTKNPKVKMKSYHFHFWFSFWGVLCALEDSGRECDDIRSSSPPFIYLPSSGGDCTWPFGLKQCRLPRPAAQPSPFFSWRPYKPYRCGECVPYGDKWKCWKRVSRRIKWQNGTQSNHFQRRGRNICCRYSVTAFIVTDPAIQALRLPSSGQKS